MKLICRILNCPSRNHSKSRIGSNSNFYKGGLSWLKSSGYGLIILLVLSVWTSCHTRKLSSGMTSTPTINNSIAQNTSPVNHPNDTPLPSRPRLSFAQYQSLVDHYIETYSPIAIREMNQYGVPASIILAQAMHESGVGRSSLAVQANNHFGVKCTVDWIGPGYYMNDDRPNECFRKYASPEESFQDHMAFLQRKRYASLFSTLDSKDYKAWAFGLKNCGYATNPQYPQVLIGLIEKYNLNRFDDSNGNKTFDQNPGIMAANPNNNPPSSTGAYSSGEPSVKTPSYTGSKLINPKQNYNSNHPKMIVYDTVHQKVIKVDTIYTYAYQKGSGPATNSMEKSSVQGSGTNTQGLQSFPAQGSGMTNGLQSSSSQGSGMTQLSMNPPPPNYPNPSQDTTQGLGSGMYRVHQGDTLYGISKKFNISLEELRNLNNLPDNGIKIDQVIKVSKP